MEKVIIIAPVAGIIAILFAVISAVSISRKDAGNNKMKEIADAISTGAKAFLFSEYKVLIFFVAALFLLIGFLLPNGWLTAVCFLIGAVFSTLAGYFGMSVATKANVRTANAAKNGGMPAALKIAFSGGAVMGLSVVGLGVIGISLIFLLLIKDSPDRINILTGFSLGASSIALFARVGGGIYTSGYSRR